MSVIHMQDLSSAFGLDSAPIEVTEQLKAR